MSTGEDEFVTIRPRQVALSHASDVAQTRAPISLTMVFAAAGAVLLVAIALWVFLYLPKHVTVPAPTPAPPATATTGAAEQTASAAPAAAAPTGPAPFEAIQIDRERKRAQETLAQFVKLQIQLDEQMHVRNWALAPFNDAQQTANDGDALFTKGQFDDAMAKYQNGIVALQTLRDEGQARFDDALHAAIAAIDRRDAAAANGALDTAATVYPDDPRVAENRKRVQRLPQIIELFDDADRAIERNDWRTALAKYRAIEGVDPKTAGLQGPLADAQNRVGNLDYQGMLTTGYSALEAGNYDVAKRAFEAALRQRPNDGAAKDGMNQAEQRATLTSIEQLRQRAARAEADERWADAVNDYEKVLTVDAAIKFAMDGRARANGRALLDQKLEAALADPGALSSDATYAQTVSLYQGASKIANAGPRLTSQLNRLETELALASNPVPVVLTSDAATEVTLSQVGALGKFARKELNLRPGRYILKGSRDGRRDVRLEVNVLPQMAPVEISCRESI
jgi:tetratricopeptide (TPR) repeat protein